MRRFRKMQGEDGAAVVETAFAATILFSLVIGMFQMFLALYAYHYVSYAAREATRWAMVRGEDCSSDSTTMPDCGAAPADVTTFVEGLGFPGINTSYMTVNTTWLTASTTQPTTWSACGTTLACKAPGNQVQVQVIYALPVSIPFVKNQSLNIVSTSTLVISQ